VADLEIMLNLALLVMFAMLALSLREAIRGKNKTGMVITTLCFAGAIYFAVAMNLEALNVSTP